MWTSGSEHDADQRRPRRLRVVTSIGGGQLPPGHGGLSGGLRSLALLPPRDHPPPLTPSPHAGKTGENRKEGETISNTADSTYDPWVKQAHSIEPRDGKQDPATMVRI